MDEIKEIDKEIEEIEKRIKELKEGKETELPPTEQGTVIPTPNVEKAVKLYNGENAIGIIALWDDGKVTACISDKEGLKGGCYTAKYGGDKLFYIMQAWATGLSENVKVKPVEVGKEVKELISEEERLAEKLKKEEERLAEKKKE